MGRPVGVENDALVGRSVGLAVRSMEVLTLGIADGA